jgi:hypothetical protein
MSVKISNKPGAERMTITPEMALQILTEYNTHNRPLSRRNVSKLAYEMEKGNWVYNPADAIVFDVNSKLANGQHRLNAIIEAELPQDFLVVTGADIDSQDVMDQQQRRTTAHQLALSGVSEAKNVATIARIYLMWTSGNISNQWKRPSTPDIRHWVESSDADALDFAVKTAIDVSKLTPLNIGPIGAAAYSAYVKDRGAAAQFFTDLVEGIGLDKGHPVLTLSKYLQRAANNGTRFREHHQLWLLVSTWNTWRAGRRIGKIMSPSDWKNDNFPRMR